MTRSASRSTARWRDRIGISMPAASDRPVTVSGPRLARVSSTPRRVGSAMARYTSRSARGRPGSHVIEKIYDKCETWSRRLRVRARASVRVRRGWVGSGVGEDDLAGGFAVEHVGDAFFGLGEGEFGADRGVE